jgi:hypothetical protein
MNLMSTLKNLNEKYVVKRTLKFDDLDISIGLQTLSSLEEVKTLESCKDLEGSLYLQTIKRNSLAYAIREVNGVALEAEIVKEDGKKVSRFLFLCDCLDGWSAPVRDTLFEMFTDMNLELEDRISKSAKFTKFNMATPDFKEIKPMFRRVEEPEEPENEVDALKKKVDKEIDAENAKLAKKG